MTDIHDYDVNPADAAAYTEGRRVGLQEGYTAGIQAVRQVINNNIGTSKTLFLDYQGLMKALDLINEIDTRKPPTSEHGGHE